MLMVSKLEVLTEVADRFFLAPCLKMVKCLEYTFSSLGDMHELCLKTGCIEKETLLG